MKRIEHEEFRREDGDSHDGNDSAILRRICILYVLFFVTLLQKETVSEMRINEAWWE